MSSSSVKRVFSSVRAIMNLAIKEHGLAMTNVFNGTFIPEDNKRKERLPVPVDVIRLIQGECRSLDDEPRWLIALISDTGMRLSEACGLLSSDIVLDMDIPHISLTEHAWRRLKTSSSTRSIPLVGASLWAAKEIKAKGKAFAFPKYCNTQKCNANSASAALNKWLKPRLPEGCVIHSFRHSLRDRLRAVECPSDIVDAIGGWTTEGIGQRYGKGYDLNVKAKWMKEMVY
jgi:integrase